MREFIRWDLIDEMIDESRDRGQSVRGAWMVYRKGFGNYIGLDYEVNLGPDEDGDGDYVWSQYNIAHGNGPEDFKNNVWLAMLAFDTFSKDFTHKGASIFDA